VTSASRAEMLPQLPKVADFVPGYEASQCYGIAAPKNTPAEIVDKLNNEINAAIATPNCRRGLPPSPASRCRARPRSSAG
jgi:tripartite-type tricarboxylate transporter receptor subunit TctC